MVSPRSVVTLTAAQVYKAVVCCVNILIIVLPAVNTWLMNRGATSLTSQTSIVTSPTLYSTLIHRSC